MRNTLSACMATAFCLAAIIGGQAAAGDCGPMSEFDLDFPGGTLAQYVQVVQRAQPCANIVLTLDDPKIAEEIRIPPMTLRRVTAYVAAQAAARTTSPREQYWLHATPIEDETGFIRAVQIGVMHDPSKDQALQLQGREPAVFSLAEPLALGRTPAALLGAIETALSVVKDEPEAVIKLHEPTGVLVALGSKRQLSIVGAVVGQLQESSQRLASRRQGLVNQIEKLEHDLREATANLDFYTKALRIAKEKLETLERSQADAKQLRDAQLELAEAERTYAYAEVEKQRYQQQLERLRTELARIEGGAETLRR